MIAPLFNSLLSQTVSDPPAAAKRLMAMAGSRDLLVVGFLLVVVLNGLTFGLGRLMAPEPLPIELSLLLGTPWHMAGLVALMLVAFTATLTVTGRVLGGQAIWEEIAILLIWLQALRALVQAVLMFVAPLAPLLAGLINFAVSAYGVYLLVTFVDTAHGFANVLKALLVMVVAAFLMATIVSLLISISGLVPMEAFSDV